MFTYVCIRKSDIDGYVCMWMCMHVDVDAKKKKKTPQAILPKIFHQQIFSSCVIERRVWGHFN